MQEVILLKCKSYEIEGVREAVKRIFDNLGGIESFIKPGMKVLIKPNLLMKKKPEDVTTTHPAIVQAIAECAAEAGAQVTIADSPGGFYSKDILKGVYSACGYKPLDNNENIKLNYNTSSADITHENGVVAKRLTIIKPALDADLIINVSKLKTHMMMTYTGAVKNLFGLIPGALKAEYHIRMKDKISFSNLLVDICDRIRPAINIMDAVIAMEGEGPSAGTPKYVGLLLASKDAFALDVAAAHIIGLGKKDIPTIERAAERGFPSELNEISIAGEDIKTAIIKDFYVPTKRQSISFFKKKAFNLITDAIKPKLLFDYDKCISCKRCGEHCPAKAIDFKNMQPHIDSSKCIRCFCCHELCPKKAIKIKRNWIVRKITKE